MKTVVTRLVVTTIVAICVFAPTPAQAQEPARAQEQIASRPRVDFRFNAGQPTALPAPLLTAARPTAVLAPTVPRRKMSTGLKAAIITAAILGGVWITLELTDFHWNCCG